VHSYIRILDTEKEAWLRRTEMVEVDEHCYVNRVIAQSLGLVSKKQLEEMTERQIPSAA
jgi:hypothetical protein